MKMTEFFLAELERESAPYAAGPGTRSGGLQ